MAQRFPSQLSLKVLPYFAQEGPRLHQHLSESSSPLNRNNSQVWQQ
ncbi:hypothetical protein GDO81_006171 [Engystomops pustulosus]|uniref:Uncharacterized protein n=1 Tax=Engystomops pustulosus TaxID=76066 RepID=A0AAV7CY65_ENGPU|nr:hypothetical protein GDO81_006171 [Engystomops pustulosus]